MEIQNSCRGGWSDKPFGEPIKRFKVISGQVKYRVKAVELQAREIVKQIQYDFRELGPVDWKPDTDLFLRGLRISLGEEKEAIIRNLERHLEEMLGNREVFVSDRENVFWMKPDGFFLDPIKYLCNTRGKLVEREFFQKFIKEQTQDQTGVLMLKATFEFWVE